MSNQKIENNKNESDRESSMHITAMNQLLLDFVDFISDIQDKILLEEDEKSTGIIEDLIDLENYYDVTVDYLSNGIINSVSDKEEPLEVELEVARQRGYDVLKNIMSIRRKTFDSIRPELNSIRYNLNSWKKKCYSLIENIMDYKKMDELIYGYHSGKIIPSDYFDTAPKLLKSDSDKDFDI